MTVLPSRGLLERGIQMPDGFAPLVPYQGLPSSSANALANVPSNDVYLPGQGFPPGGMNGLPANGSVPSSEGGGIIQNFNGPNPDVANWLNKHFPGHNFPTAPWNPSPSDINRNINGTRKAVNDSQAQITNLQHSVDQNQEDNSHLFGFQTGPNACQEIWQFADSESFFNPVINMQVNAAAGGAILMSQCLLRLKTSTSFLTWLNFCEASQGFPDVEDLNAAVGSAQPVGMSDLEYLQTTLPAYAWEENHENSGMVGMTATSLGDGIPRSYYWSPPAMSSALLQQLLIDSNNDLLERFRALWDYTPSSGPPVRSGISDTKLLLSMIPFQF